MKKLSATFAFISMAACLLCSATSFASAWLPVHSQYIMNTFEPKQLEDNPVWTNQPSNPTTHKTITLQWSTDINASHYELWLNGNKHIYTTDRAEFYFTTPEQKSFKIRACNGHICSPFSKPLELDVTKRLEVIFGEQGVIEAGGSAQVKLTLLEQLQATDKVEFSIDKSVWHTSQSSNAQFTFAVNIAEPGQYQLHIKINGEVVQPISFRVYGQPTKAVSSLAIGKVGQTNYHSQQSLVLSSPEDLVLHWQATEEIAPPNTGYYKYRIENGDEGTIYRTAPYLTYQYGQNEFHKEISISSNGKYDIELRACNRLSAGEVCGPTQKVHVYVGVPATPYRKPTQQVAGVYVNGVLGDTTPYDFVRTEPDSTVYLSWSKSAEVDSDRGYYLVEVDYPQGHTKQSLVFGVAPYIAKRYNDNDSHYEMRFDAAKQDYIVTVRACNPYNETGGFEVNCGPRSQAVRINSKPVEVKYDVTYTGVNNKVGYVDQEVIVKIQTQNGGQLKQLEAKINDGEWITLSSEDGQVFNYNFGLLPTGPHTIVFKADNYYDSDPFTFDIKVPLDLVAVDNLSLSATKLTYGDKVKIFWQKPAYYDDELVYDIYITKQQDVPLLWRRKLTPAEITEGDHFAIQRGPLYRRGDHLVQVVPCSIDGRCASRTGGVTYNVGGDVLPQVIRFDVLSGGTNHGVTFDWAMPELFTSDVVVTYWVKAPNSSHFVEYQPNAPLSTFGTYSFYVRVCEAGNPLICNKYRETEKPILISGDMPTLSANNNALSWSATNQAENYILQKSLIQTESWETVLTSNKTIYTAPLPAEDVKYRVKACISRNVCTPWSNTVNVFSIRKFSQASVNTVADSLYSSISAPTSDAVGTLGGQAGVNGGAASYNLPIQIAPGRNGVQPKVSLNYSSRAGNGIAGVGVSLSAGSQISRCSATYAQDGFTQNPQYNSNDRLCLDGQRLIAVSGNYGEDSTIYRTEIESFVRVTQSGAINSNSTSFTAEYANGTTAYFGQDVDSRVIHSGQSAAYSWLISHQHDATSKNYIHYDYKAYGAGERLLSDIYYTGSGVTTQGQQKVSFTYEANNQPRSGYIAGGYYESTQKLKTITAYTITSTKVRTYNLTYETSHISGRDLLKTVNMCVGSKCLPATTFAWQNSNTQKLEFEPMSDANGTMLYQGVETLSSVLPRGDHNADGVRDWQGYYVDAEGNSTQHNMTFNACRQNIFTRQHECHDGDFDQDGKSDEWVIEQYTLKLKLSNTGAVVNTGIAMPYDIRVGLDDSHIRQIGDFNGDGYPDILVYVGDETPHVDLYYHTQNVTAPIASSASHSWQLPSTTTAPNQHGLLNELSVVGDISGDGTLDIMVTKTGANSTKPSYIQPLPQSFWLGDDNFSHAVASPFNITESLWVPSLSYFIDINGDGLPDWLGWTNEAKQLKLKYRLNLGGSVSFAPEQVFNGTGGLIELRNMPVQNGQEQDSRDIPKYYSAFKVEDIDFDGIPELLMPDIRVYETCATVSSAGIASTKCGEDIYGTYKENASSSIRLIDAAANDRSIYRYKALKFKPQTNGVFAVSEISTDLIASAYDSAFVDAYGTGLKSLVFNHYLNPTDHSHGRSGATGLFAGHEKTLGVYINRNYGAGTGATGADYAPIDMLQKVENGVGVVSEWTQRPLSSSLTDYETGATNTDNQQGYFNFASSMYVVNKFTQSNGIGGTNTKEYGYFGAMYNAQGRGFMGFKSVIEKDVTLGVVTRSDFKQIFPYQGKLTRQAQFKISDYTSRYSALLGDKNAENNAINYSEHLWDENPNHNVTGVSHIYQTNGHQISRDLHTKATVVETRTRIDGIDGCGNVTAQTQIREDDWGLHTTSTSAAVSSQASCSNSSAAKWWPNKLDSKSVTQSAITSRHADDPLKGNTTLDGTYTITTSLSDYHANRKPQTVSVSADDTSKGKTTKTVFNAYGLPTSVSETAQVLNSTGSWVDSTRTTKMTYSKDGTNEAADGYFPLVITNAKGHQVKTITDRATGQPKQQKRQVSSSKWVTTTYGYDDFYRPFSQKTEGMPIQYSAVQSTLHDDHKPSHAVMMVKQVSAGTPEVRVYKDKLGRTIRTASQAFDGSWVYQDVSFDSLGRTTYESMPYKQSGTSYGTKYSGFDVLGRPATKVVDQQCGQNTTGTMDVTYGYSGLTTTIDVSETCHSIALGQMSRTYNSLKQLVRTKDAAGNFTYYGYNSLGLPAVIEDAAGNQIKATYNALGRKTKVDDPNQGVTGFTYNGFGELQQETRGSTTVKLYVDVLGRVVTRTATGENDLSYSYDANNGYGQMTSASGNGVSHTYNFDTLGRPTAHTASGSGKSYTTSTLYDGNYGRVKGVRYPNNLTLEYTYNDKGYQTSVKNAANDYVYQTVESQDILGNITQSVLGNGLIQKQYYSLTSGQMTGSYTETDNSQQLMALNYTQYDGFGNLKAMTVTTGSFDNQHSFSESYVYDGLHRLTSNKIDGITTISYDYDVVGNLTSKSDYASEYNYSDHLSGHSGGGANAVKKVQKTNGTWAGFSYDARGNMTKGDGLTSAIYNAMDKPTSLTKNGITSTFVYGPDHMRFKQVKGNTTTYYAGAYEEEIEGSKTTWRAYIGDVALISQGTGEVATIRYTHRDRLGSTRLFTDHNGKVIAERNFDPFGKPRLSTGGLKAISQLDDKDKTKTNRGFTDHEHLDELELIHMNGRMYDYNLGRFLSVDPIIQSPGDSQSINPYSYIMNNPLSGTDPTGYCAAATGTRIKSCGDMKVEVKVTMKDGSTKSGSTVVKDVNFKNGAEVNSAMAQGAGAIGGAMKAMEIGSQKQIATASPQSGNTVGQTSSPTSNSTALDTVKGVAKAGLNSLKKGGIIGLGLAPTMMGNGELSEADKEEARKYSDELQEAQLSGLRHAEKQVSRHRGNKVAVIGQGQETRVIPYARAVKGVSFSIPDRYLYESEYMSQFPSHVQEHLSVAFNRGWINGVMNAKYQIHDVQMAKGRSVPGPWYGAELQEVARRRYPTTKVNLK